MGSNYAQSLAWYHRNKDKVRERDRKRYSSDPVYRAKEIARGIKRIKNNPRIITDQRNKREYNLSRNQYDEMLINQNGRCAICLDAFNRFEPYVDHDHVTGKTRELLCQHCNTAIGMVRESTRILENIILYLKKHGE